jgi:hypothetical protein
MQLKKTPQLFLLSRRKTTFKPTRTFGFPIKKASPQVLTKKPNDVGFDFLSKMAI